MRVYWANALFSQADRDFNAKSASLLRSRGFEVCSPQDFVGNAPGAVVSSEEIFCADTSDILACDAVVACLDQESIDAGVACEVGVAYAAAVPLVGLYTDIRQDRPAEGRMYKNLYVLGCLGAKPCRSVEEVIARLECLKDVPAVTTTDSTSHYDSVATRYEPFIRELATWYRPSWEPTTRVRAAIPRGAGKLRVLEIGCGPGLLPDALGRDDIDYLGYDPSTAMIAEAHATSRASSQVRFTSDWSVVDSEGTSAPFDVVVAQFVVHHMDAERAWADFFRLTSPRGRCILTDLTCEDLPKVVDQLARNLALPIARRGERRPSLHAIARDGSRAGFVVRSAFIDTPKIEFASSDALDRYFATFGIYRGLDLPLAFERGTPETNRERVLDALRKWSWPLIDERDFVTCTLEKRP